MVIMILPRLPLINASSKGIADEEVIELKIFLSNILTVSCLKFRVKYCMGTTLVRFPSHAEALYRQIHACV